MADDTSKVGNPDRQRINVNQEHELRNWAMRFGVSEDALRTAVTQVGDRAQDVERYLKDSRR